VVLGSGTGTLYLYFHSGLLRPLSDTATANFSTNNYAHLCFRRKELFLYLILRKQNGRLNFIRVVPWEIQAYKTSNCLIVSRLVKFPTFYGSLSVVNVLTRSAMGPYPDTDESTPHIHTIFN
jgi:hypothetical protein